MKEAKYRGKRVDNDEWVYGYLIYDLDWNDNYVPFIDWKDDSYLSGIGEEAVKENTIGSYVGIKDISGKEIYEGDIVKIAGKIVAEIAWSEEYLAYILITTEVKDAFENLGDYLDYSIEVIGNVVDTPNLLWEGK